MTKAIEESSEQIIFMDLHTTSGETPPFLWMIPDGSTGKLALSLPLPIVHDVEKRIPGAMGVYIGSLGHIVLCAEGGQHDSSSAVDNLEALLWIALVRSGNLAKESINDIYENSLDTIEKAIGSVPHSLEIIYHHRTNPNDGFEMLPGYVNFQSVSKGELLANDNNGPIKAVEDCRVLLPRYQYLGEDGFLLVREK